MFASLGYNTAACACNGNWGKYVVGGCGESELRFDRCVLLFLEVGVYGEKVVKEGTLIANG